MMTIGDFILNDRNKARSTDFGGMAQSYFPSP